VVGRHRRVHDVVHQALDAEAGQLGVGVEAALLDDRDIKFAAAQRRHGLRRVQQLEVDHDARSQPAEGGHGERHDRPGGGRERADPKTPARAGGELGELRLGVGELAEDALGVTHERLAGGGEAHALGLALDQLDARLRLEAGDLLRDGGLGVRQRLGCRRERAAQRDLAQHLQKAEIIHKRTLLHRSETII
jgi:hypothetical protein